MPLPQRLGCLGWLVLGAVVMLAPLGGFARPLGGFAWWPMSEGDLDAALDGTGGRPPVPGPVGAVPATLDPALEALHTQVVDLLRQGGPIHVHRRPRTRRINAVRDSSRCDPAG